MQPKMSMIAAAAALAVAGMAWEAGAQTAPPVDRTDNAAERAADRTGDAAERAADRTGDTAQKAGDTAKQGFKGTAAAPDAEGIRDVLASSTEAALTENGLDDLVERFVDADRNRIGDISDEQMAQLNTKVKALRDAWKAKYNDEFDIENEEQVYPESFARITQSEIGRGGEAVPAGQRQPADQPKTGTGTGTDNRRSDADDLHGDRQVLGNADLQTMPKKQGPQGGIDMTAAADQDIQNRRSGDQISGSSNASTGSETIKAPASGNETAAADADAARPGGNVVGASDPADAAMPAADRTVAQADRADNAAERAADRAGDAAGGVDRPDSPAADANRNDPGRNIATVQIAASHGLPALTVPMVHEFPDLWKIDVPDNVDNAALLRNFSGALDKLTASKDAWPADPNEAYRAVTHTILAAVLDKTQQGHGGGAGAGTALPQ